MPPKGQLGDFVAASTLRRRYFKSISIKEFLSMAVSQFLRPGSLMDAVKGYLTPETVRSASSLVGESESSTRQTLNGSVPTVLSGLTSMVSTRDGVSSFGGLIRDG